jgi:pyruvate/2-oxoglutarate/acetoin dehydrogenase E1 component
VVATSYWSTTRSRHAERLSREGIEAEVVDVRSIALVDGARFSPPS